MSAENMLTIRRMNNGQFWVVNVAVGDTVRDAYGSSWAAAKCDSYLEAVHALELISCEEIEIGYVDRSSGELVWPGVTIANPEYVYAEHGYEIPSLEELMRDSPWLVHGAIQVKSAMRSCLCVDENDLVHRNWLVVEHCFSTNQERVIGSGLSYARAVNLAQVRYAWQVGDVVLQLPMYFLHLIKAEGHDCYTDEWSFRTCD